MQAPYLHELGHAFHYNLIEKIVKSQRIDYNRAKYKLKKNIIAHINEEKRFNKNYLGKALSRYAHNSFSENANKGINEVMVEWFAADFKNELTKLIDECVKEALEV